MSDLDLQKIIAALIAAAVRGDVQASRLLLDRLLGRVAPAVEPLDDDRFNNDEFDDFAEFA